MAGKRNRTINLPAPYLRRVWLDRAQVCDAAAYPFCLPFLANDFELGFDRASSSTSRNPRCRRRGRSSS